jgi:hypothetical protein
MVQFQYELCKDLTDSVQEVFRLQSGEDEEDMV